MGWLLARPLGAPVSRLQERASVLWAMAVAAALAVGGVAAARWSAQAHAAEQGWLLEWRRYAQTEPAMLSDMSRVMTGARDGRVSDAEVVQWLEGTGIPFYSDAAARFAALSLPPGSPLAGERAAAWSSSGAGHPPWRLLRRVCVSGTATRSSGHRELTAPMSRRGGERLGPPLVN